MFFLVFFIERRKIRVIFGRGEKEKKERRGKISEARNSVLLSVFMNL